MEDVQLRQPLCGQFAFLRLTLSFFQDSHAALLDLGRRHLVRTAETLTIGLMNDFAAISLILIPDTVSSAGSWTYSQLLKQADVKLLSNTECSGELSYKERITENMQCAASPDWSTDSCKVSIQSSD